MSFMQFYLRSLKILILIFCFSYWWLHWLRWQELLLIKILVLVLSHNKIHPLNNFLQMSNSCRRILTYHLHLLICHSIISHRRLPRIWLTRCTSPSHHLSSLLSLRWNKRMKLFLRRYHITSKLHHYIHWHRFSQRCNSTASLRINSYSLLH